MLSNNADDLIVVARVARTRGLRGEVAADLLTDFPGRFESLDSLIGVAPDESHRSLQIEEQWFHGRRIIFKFVGYDSIDKAKELVGFQLAVPETERVELPKDQFYEWELTGCRVETVAGKSIGTVREVMRTGGVELLVVVNSAHREVLVPLAEEICVEIAPESKLIRVNPPEGLLEL